MSPRIAVALSGGVDSMTAACLLRKHSADIIGIHFLTGFEETSAEPTAHLVRVMGDRLQIPVHVVDLSADFKHQVVDYFTATYLSGETPNPCVVCNPSIKFGAVLRMAEGLGAEALATGHYAIVRQDPTGRYRLFKGSDFRKDQSYFLARLSQTQLAKARLPLGSLTKSAVREFAARYGLRPPISKESQDVCFIKAGTYREFLSRMTGHGFKPGPIVTAERKIVGQHGGLHAFTVGQRRGINCPAADPYYVLRLDMARNQLVVGLKEDLVSKECMVAEINWIGPPPSGPLRVHTRVRYRTPECASTLIPLDAQRAHVCFDQPQMAVTPGQAAVFYDGDEVLGGGFISGKNDTGYGIRDTG